MEDQKLQEKHLPGSCDKPTGLTSQHSNHVSPERHRSTGNESEQLGRDLGHGVSRKPSTPQGHRRMRPSPRPPCLLLGKPAHAPERPALLSFMAVLHTGLSDLLISRTFLSKARDKHKLETNTVSKHSCTETTAVRGKVALKNKCNALTGTSG